MSLLRALDGRGTLSGINSLSFRTPEGIRTTPLVTAKEFDFPSPFQSGFYDRLLAEHPDIEFVPVIETNRGCPNRCAYCSWANSSARVRLFPLERVYADLEWVAAHKMEYVGVADANFGMFPRDEQIVDFLIDLNRRTGYPKKFQVSYAKDSGERVFRISEKLNRVGLCKAVTLSFQTMSEAAQANIGRANIGVDYYRDLLRRYTGAGIPTYTELILGLPGVFFCRTSDYFTGLGLMIGFFLAVAFEERFVRFEMIRYGEDKLAALWTVLRLVGGIAVYFALNTLLKLPFSAEFLESATIGAFLVRTVAPEISMGLPTSEELSDTEPINVTASGTVQDVVEKVEAETQAALETAKEAPAVEMPAEPVAAEAPAPEPVKARPF